MYVIDSPDTGVSEVQFKPKTRVNDLVHYLKTEHEQALNDRAGLEEKWKSWLQQANSRRPRPDARARDSQIDMPLTKRRLIQHKSRLANPIFQQDELMVAKSRKNMHHDFAVALEDFMDYITDKVDMQAMAEDWIDQFQVFNFGCVKTAFTKKVKWIKQWEDIDLETYMALAKEGQKSLLRKEMDNDTVLYYIETEKRVVTFEGVDPEIIPIEDVICPITTASVNSADWFTHRSWLTKPTVEARIREGIYNEKDQNGDKVIESLGNPYAGRKKLLDHGTTKDETDQEAEPSSKQYEILETYLSYDYDKSGKPKEIIVTWDRKSGTILRCVDNFYHNYCRPFVLHSYQRVHGSIFGVPATYVLEPLHVANSASFNQRLDAASKANEKILIGPPGSLKEAKQIWDRQGVTGGFYEGSLNKDEIIDLTLAQPFSQLPELENKFESQADDLMALSDYSFGREQIQRPTATGQVSIIEESKQPLYSQLERFRKSFAEVVMHMLSRYRQFYPEGVEYYMESTNPESQMALQRMLLEWPSDAIEDAVIIETKVTSAQMSKHIRKQEVVALLDRVPQMYEQLMGMAQAASQPGPTAMIAAKLLNAYQGVIDQFLKEFEVPGREELNPELVQEAQVAQMVAQQMQQMQSQIQSMGGQLQQLQAQNAQLQGAGGQGPGMGGPPMQGPPVQGPPGMGGPAPGPQV